MKRILTILLTVLVLLSMSACGGKDRVPSSSQISVSWPRSELGKIVPKPDFGTLKINVDSSSILSFDIEEASKDNYSTYVDTCMDNGFSIDYERMDTIFSAYNEDGYNLSIMYYESQKTISVAAYTPSENGNNAISEAPISTPESSENENSEPESSVPESEPTPTDGIRPEFKEAMDSYEAFYQEYAEFMKKYSESENALEMLGEYMEYMNKLTEMSEKFDKLGNQEMSDEELKYYLDVQTRVSKLLVDIAS